MPLVGTRLLNHFEKRCSELFRNIDDHFGDIHIYLFGDYRQLPAVLDQPVYAEHFNILLLLKVHWCFNSFQAFYEL